MPTTARKAEALARQTAAAQQAERERQFGEATNTGWAAYLAGNLANAIAEADKSLVIHGDDAGMTNFPYTTLFRSGSAERKTERERQFGVATNAGWAAYRAGNLTSAIAEADKALASQGKDVEIRKQRADALALQTAAAQQAERERQFGEATNTAWAAYRAGNLTIAIAEADKALTIHGDDAAMKKLTEDAMLSLHDALPISERERQFGVATNAGWAAYRAGNLTNAIAEADKALAIHGDDAGMKKLKADAAAQQTSVTEHEEREGTSALTTNVGSGTRPDGDK